jgi:hypothetical protein
MSKVYSPAPTKAQYFANSGMIASATLYEVSREDQKTLVINQLRADGFTVSDAGVKYQLCTQDDWGRQMYQVQVEGVGAPDLVGNLIRVWALQGLNDDLSLPDGHFVRDPGNWKFVPTPAAQPTPAPVAPGAKPPIVSTSKSDQINADQAEILRLVRLIAKDRGIQ